METADFRGKAGRTQTHTVLSRLPSRGGAHWLRGPALHRRCGRMSDAAPLKAVGAGGTTFAAAGAIFLLSAGEAPAVCCSGI